MQELEQAIQSGFLTVRIERYPTISDEELTKLKKKLKGPALKDLKVLTCQALVPLSELQKPGS